MKKAGIGLIALGFYCVIFAFNMDVVVGTTYNIGLMNERQNVVFLSGIIFLAGIILFGFGFSAKEESKNFKHFAMACFLLPILLLAGVKLVVTAQHLVTSALESAEQNKIKKQAEETERAEKLKAEQREKEWELEMEARQKAFDNLKPLKDIDFKITGNSTSEILTNAMEQHSYEGGGALYAIEHKDVEEFSIAIYTLEGSGGGNHYERYMIGFMNEKIIRPIQIGARAEFSDRAIKTHKMMIEIDGVTLGENDGYCCPSKPMTKKFEISNNGFREITAK
jgi:uncharacterized membrane protein YhdT